VVGAVSGSGALRYGRWSGDFGPSQRAAQRPNRPVSASWRSRAAFSAAVADGLLMVSASEIPDVAASQVASRRGALTSCSWLSRVWPAARE
jgi:hypothetical protein